MATSSEPPAADAGDLTLGQLLTRSLRNAAEVTEAPSPNDVAIQSLLAATLSDLTLCAKLIEHLGVLSPNETLDDISTRDLRCLLVPSLQAQLALLVRTRGGVERLDWLRRAEGHLRRFVDLVERYEVVGDERRKTIAGPRVGETDPARRRAGKIAQFKMEKEIKGTLEELRTRRRTRRVRGSAAPSTSSSSAPTPAPADADDDFLSSDDDEGASVARPLLLNLLTLHYLRAFAELDSLTQEVELLEHGMKLSEIPSPPPGGGAGADGREGAREGEDAADRWRLDVLPNQGAGPVLSPGGKVLRPFTILPSSTSSAGGALGTRVRLQSEVFRESWRLPTMTIDEYLAEEQARGNVLQGGGERTTEEVENARREEKALEEEDTREGYEKEEQGLRKAREWDDYRDVHRKGEGNMHNRG
ncbi:Type 2A phosphatase-associated protein 42 [Rhodotorula kratochvilovae]